VAIDRACGIFRLRIPNIRMTPVRAFTPPPVAPPRGPAPLPFSGAQVPQLVVHRPVPVLRACQKSQDVPAARSTTIMRPSDPVVGCASAGMRTGRPSRSQAPQSSVQSTVAVGVPATAVKTGSPYA
jgi:hypothetical protein